MNADLRNREYNGWDNRFTWQVHLHLSNEQALYLEMAEMIAYEPHDASAGRLVEQWVTSSITNWMNRVPGRNRAYDGYICLLVWDMLGATLAYAEWDDLVKLLTGYAVVSNVFTMTLNRHIQSSPVLRSVTASILRDASSIYAAADALKAAFETLLADWVERVTLRRKIDASVVQVFDELLQNAYGLIVWEHVARAFRPDY